MSFFQRLLYSTPGRLRIFGGLLIVLVAAPLIVMARQACHAQGDITIWMEGFVWYAVAAAIWVIAAPRIWQRLAHSFRDATPSRALPRAIGSLNLVLGVFLGWVAFFVV